MALSARNQLRGQIREVNFGDIAAHVVVPNGDNESASMITKRSAEKLPLQAGDTVSVAIKSTEVTIQK